MRKSLKQHEQRATVYTYSRFFQWHSLDCWQKAHQTLTTVSSASSTRHLQLSPNKRTGTRMARASTEFSLSLKVWGTMTVTVINRPSVYISKFVIKIRSSALWTASFSKNTQRQFQQPRTLGVCWETVHRMLFRVYQRSFRTNARVPMSTTIWISQAQLLLD